MRVLGEGAIAVLTTLIEAPRSVGAKLLTEESGARVGSLGDSTLDEAVAQYAPIFLESRAEARAFRVAEL
ncbi:MAG TPA: XdhC family protein, partial [Pyrinomonadaceae bacterium]|nr:XdhC family protein [Pyrinomonadaceae bacterium]